MKLYLTEPRILISADRSPFASSPLRLEDSFLDTYTVYLMFKHKLYRNGYTDRPGGGPCD